MNITLSGVDYSTNAKLDAFAQLNVARKLGPSLPIVEGLIDSQNKGKDKSLLTVLMLSHIGDSDSEYVIKKCLSAVLRKDASGKLSKIQAQDGSLMFDDISLQDMLALTIEVIEENLGDFFRTALANMDKEAKQV